MTREYILLDVGFYDSIIEYTQLYSIIIPNPHSSGYWEDGFEFNNQYYMLLQVI